MSFLYFLIVHTNKYASLRVYFIQSVYMDQGKLGNTTPHLYCFANRGFVASWHITYLKSSSSIDIQPASARNFSWPGYLTNSLYFSEYTVGYSIHCGCFHFPHRTTVLCLSRILSCWDKGLRHTFNMDEYFGTLSWRPNFHKIKISRVVKKSIKYKQEIICRLSKITFKFPEFV